MTYKDRINCLGLKFYNTRKESDFNELYNSLYTYYANIINKSYRRVLYKREDILNDTFMCIWKYINQFNTEYKFYNWAFTILINKIYLYYEKVNRENRYVSVEDMFYNDIPYDNDDNIYGDFLNELYDIEMTNIYNMAIDNLKNLKATHRDLLMDQYFECLPIKKIAIKRDLPEQVVKNRLRAGKRHLRKFLIDEINAINGKKSNPTL